MIRYRKGRCPEELSAHAATPGADWTGFGGKQATRAALVRDQRALCAYCQRRIDASPEVMKIDHWIARSDRERGAAHELEWTNLLGACLGRTGTERHCDTSRGDRPVDDQRLTLHPVEGRGQDPRQHLRYQADGTAYSYPPSVEVERDITVLNLNAPFLKRGRETVLEAVRQALARVGFTPTHVARMLAELDEGPRAREFTEVARDYLTRKLRRLGG